MKELKLIGILCLILILFVGIGCVSAADNITAGGNDYGSYGEDNAITHLDDVHLDQPSSLSNGKNVGSFKDLKNDISGLKDGDTFNLTKDYSYGFGVKYSIEDNDVIKITKNNITINGNGHIINGAHKTNIFNVMGNNVKITNVTFMNAMYDDNVNRYIPDESPSTTCTGYNYNNRYSPYPIYSGEVRNGEVVSTNKIQFHAGEVGASPVRWFGNNGVLSDCTFQGNSVYHGRTDKGGALTWKGNNGLIRNCKFTGNLANTAGGAIYIGGANNTIANSVFKKSFSISYGDAIFMDHNYKNCTITDCTFDNLFPIIDENAIDLKYLKNNFTTTIGNDTINLDALLYKSMFCNNNFDYNDHISCSFRHDNFDYVFSITSNLPNGFVVSEYQFNKVGCANDIFENLHAGNYVKNLMVNITVQSAAEYNNLINHIKDEKDKKVHSVLNINVKCPLNINKLFTDFNEVNMAGDVGTFNELSREINKHHPGDVINLTKNYYFNEKCDKDSVMINIDNITVNGNSYVIDGMKKPVMINVSGDNVKISNLTFINALNNQNGKSMITWSGNEGVLSSCNFAGNVALNGGAVNWMGNNALITKCIFIANSADFGGAIYMGGINNKIIKSIFENCKGNLGYEAVYLSWGDENCNVLSCSFDNVIPILDEKSLNLHVTMSNAGNFADLASEINRLKPGDTLSLTRDYYGVNDYTMIINNDNVTINGNGHVIDAMNHSAVFKVKGNNVRICNLNFINAACNKIKVISTSKLKNITYDSGESIISWIGNNGVLSGCTFACNSAVNGGAVTWMGSNGLIDYCIFINNTASGVGGAVYVPGENNTIINTVFRDSSSKLTCEAIYTDCKHTCNISHCIANNKVPVIHGELSGINADYLHYGVYQNIAGEKIDLVSSIYKTIMYNCALKYNENINYAFVYSNDTFLFTINGKLNNGEYLINYEYYFANVTFHNNKYAWNNIFSSLLKHSNIGYNKSISVIKNVYVKNGADYDDIINLKKSDDVKYLSGRDIDIAGADISLNVTFTGKLSIVTGETWKVHKSGYDVIRVNGQSSRISLAKGSEKKIWVSIDEKDFFSATKLIIDGFNCHVENDGGKGIFEEVSFKNAHNNDDFNRGFGGAILNQGSVICKDCYFYNNSAKCGGAVFNAGYFEYEDCIFENNHASKEGPDICSVDDAKEKEGDGSITVICSDKGIEVINGENITDTGEYTYVHVKSESLVKATVIGAVTGFVFGAVTGLVVGICTLNPVAGIAAGVAAGVAAGAAMGAYTSWYMTSNNYDPELKVWKVYATVIGISVVAGAVGGLMGGYVGSGLEELEVAVESEVASESDAMTEGIMDTIFGIGF
ncbi:hypothetical protein [Methanobrevibacter sp.]|uniref:hypothetical protein n=1 Tax=Methanobrevibacter sp. TaxID=66852 RepID=UPI00388FB273